MMLSHYVQWITLLEKLSYSKEKENAVDKKSLNQIPKSLK